MGKWNQRYIPRRNYRNYDYEDPPPSNTYNNHSSGAGDNRVPSWEIDYCTSAKVPWNKILASKKYISCYPSVLNWDASAGKEALEDAKQRYWAMINGFPCDNPLPDPDMYIDEIDWNPFMDPELMEDLELQVIDPDDAQKVDRLETINEEVGLQPQLNKNESNNDNPWESNNGQGTVAVQGWDRWDDSINLKNDSSQAAVQGWNRWEDSINLKNDDPWEQICNKPADSLKNNAWRSENESSGWNKGADDKQTGDVRQEGWGSRENKTWGSGDGSWGRNKGIDNRQTVAVRQEGWGKRENNTWRSGDGSWGRNKGIGNRPTVALGQEGWGSRENNTWRSGNESWGNRSSEHWDSQRSGQCERSFRGGCRKRESSVQHTSKYKSSRYQRDSYGDRRQF